MICKWCGGSIASSDPRCKRCGREVPALSDCGGFYDLVPDAKKATVARPEPVGPPARPVGPSLEIAGSNQVRPVERKNDRNKAFSIPMFLTGIGFMIVGLFLVAVFCKVDQYANEVDRLRKELGSIVEMIEATAGMTEPVETDPVGSTGSAVETDPLLAEQDVRFTVKINEEVEADFDLGNRVDVAVVTCGPDAQAGTVASVTYSLKEVDATVSLTIDCKNEFRTWNASVVYAIDGVVFGHSEVPEICKWQYRFGEVEDWKELPEGASIQTDEAGKTESRIREAVLQELSEGNEAEFELRCEIIRTNIDNGSITIVVEGIRVCSETNTGE